MTRQRMVTSLAPRIVILSCAALSAQRVTRRVCVTPPAAARPALTTFLETLPPEPEVALVSTWWVDDFLGGGSAHGVTARPGGTVRLSMRRPV